MIRKDKEVQKIKIGLMRKDEEVQKIQIELMRNDQELYKREDEFEKRDLVVMEVQHLRTLLLVYWGVVIVFFCYVIGRK